MPVKTGTIINAPLAREFLNGEKELIPIVFSHGLSAHRTTYTALCRDYASHGYIVFALNHGDNSCSFFLDKNGRPYYYDNS
jgi:predicted dienelactone hydrolase